MRKMFSKNQIKRLIEDDISAVTVTKGEYTTDAHLKITKVGHCITIAGNVTVDNTSGSAITNGLNIVTINNIDLSFADGQSFNGVHEHDSSTSLTTAYIEERSGESVIIINNPVQTGSTYYYFDVDLIDGDDLPVLDYPGA
jgi:hypothetical protein